MSVDWFECCGQAKEHIGGIGCTCERKPPKTKVVRNLSTPEARRFWGKPDRDPGVVLLLAALFLAALFLSSCAPTFKAQVRRREAYRVALCRQDRACVAESVARCVAAGLERSCGTDGSWGR